MTYYANLPLITSTFHVYKILSGGWSNGEVRQQGVLDASAGVYSEFLVATNNGCIQATHRKSIGISVLEM
ncbi:hypothetical protein [Shewanella sp. GutCb]|uniref:hypothetical protein n=1 Tax=Shewanella sp. GutCb TaxID=2058315 RepID=UPI000C7E2D7D|nr:hypothetical protein [Shewanella sp. GutCb]